MKRKPDHLRATQGMEVNPVTEIKYLGITLNQKLPYLGRPSLSTKVIRAGYKYGWNVIKCYLSNCE